MNINLQLNLVLVLKITIKLTKVRMPQIVLCRLTLLKVTISPNQELNTNIFLGIVSCRTFFRVNFVSKCLETLVKKLIRHIRFFFKNRFHFYNLIEKKFHTGTIRIEGENESR